MKKSLLAVAAIGAFASAAQAQSSVTVYGILDVGYVGSNVRDTLTAGNTTVAASTPAKKTNQSGFTGRGAEQTSRLGFKGVEDLGGGNSAFFTIEMNLYPEDANGFALTNRQTFVGLKKNGLGAGSIGYQYTPIFNADGATDPGQHNGAMGNVIYIANNNSSANAFAQVNMAGAFTNSAANSLFVKSDKFAGFTAQAMYSLNNANQTQFAAGGATYTTSTGGINNQTLWGLGVDYTWKKLFVTAAYQSVNAQNNTTLVSAAGATGTVAAAGTAAAAYTLATANSNVTDNQTYAGATYDFGILKTYAQWSNRKVTSKLNSGNWGQRQAQQLGVRSYITPVVEGWASIGNGKYTEYGSSHPTANFTGYQMGANYYLSKRTNLYGIFGSLQTSSSSTFNGAGSSGNNYAVGVRHTF